MRKWSTRKKGAGGDEEEEEDPDGGDPRGGGEDKMTLTQEEAEKMAATAAEQAVQKALAAAGISVPAPAASAEPVVVTDADTLAASIGSVLKPVLKGMVTTAVQEALAASSLFKGIAGTLDELGTHIDDHMEALARSNSDAFKSVVAEVQKGFSVSPTEAPAAPVVPVIPTSSVPVVPVPNGSVIGQSVSTVAVNKGAVNTAASANEGSAYELVNKGMALQQQSGESIPGLSDLSIAVSAGEAVDPALIASVSAAIKAAGG